MATTRSPLTSSPGEPPVLPTIADVQAARTALRDTVNHTPLLLSRSLSAISGGTVHFKAENLQRTGSFKIRGALNAIAHLTPEQRGHGVVAASAGNHAQGVALAGRAAGIDVLIVMAEGASPAKIAATQGYGATVVLEGAGYADAYRHAEALARETGRMLIHAYDDRYVIAGQGTIGLELLDQLPEVDVVVVPVGGGGLISGIGLAVKTLSPQVELIGVQAAAAPAAAQSFHSGAIETTRPGPTLADGVAVSRPGPLTHALMRRFVDDIVTVGEREIGQAMVLLAERSKLVVEGAGAVGAAAVLAGLVNRPGKRIVVVLSGGNVSLGVLAELIEERDRQEGAAR
ncbi:MAG: threonine ammonia-lyase [Chloroflexi bacterium]|nr:threonine ammonia-lyase [Chloroflexota bacterium]